MTTATTAQGIAKLQTDITSAKIDLGLLSPESENARTLLIVERVVGLLDALDERTRVLEAAWKVAQGDGK